MYQALTLELWEKRKISVLSYLLNLNSSIFSLQEVSNEITTQITNSLNKKHGDVFDFIWKQRKSGTNDGCGTIYRKDLLELKETVAQNYPGDTHIFMATLFEVINSKQQFWNINTHVNWKTRNEDLLHLMKHVEKDLKLQSVVPKIAMGDFNAEAKDSWYPHLSKFGIIDGYKSFHNNLPKFSYNSGKGASKYIDFFLLWGIPKESITNVFMGPDKAAPLNLSTISYMPNESTPSDHLPVTIEFRL